MAGLLRREPQGIRAGLALDDGSTLTENIAMLNYLADRAAENSTRHSTVLWNGTVLKNGWLYQH